LDGGIGLGASVAPPRVGYVAVYLVVNDFGKFGRAFVETDLAESDRETVLRISSAGNIRTPSE
jgi:hypothetical protein